MSEERLDGLRAAVELSPDNHGLRLVLAEALRAEGHDAEALDHLELLVDQGALPEGELIATGELAVRAGRLQLAAPARCSARSRTR